MQFLVAKKDRRSSADAHRALRRLHDSRITISSALASKTGGSGDRKFGRSEDFALITALRRFVKVTISLLFQHRVRQNFHVEILIQ